MKNIFHENISLNLDHNILASIKRHYIIRHGRLPTEKLKINLSNYKFCLNISRTKC